MEFSEDIFKNEKQVSVYIHIYLYDIVTHTDTLARNRAQNVHTKFSFCILERVHMSIHISIQYHREDTQEPSNRDCYLICTKERDCPPC